MCILNVHSRLLLCGSASLCPVVRVSAVEIVNVSVACGTRLAFLRKCSVRQNCRRKRRRSRIHDNSFLNRKDAGEFTYNQRKTLFNPVRKNVRRSLPQESTLEQIGDEVFFFISSTSWADTSRGIAGSHHGDTCPP